MLTDSSDFSLDTVLTEVGAFGLFQIVSYALIFIPSMFSSAYQNNFLFSANTLEYRCKVPECDGFGENNRDLEYNQQWLNLAIPSDSTNNNEIANCVRYAPAVVPITTSTKNLTTLPSNETGQCTADSFNTMQTIACTEYVYASDERNIQTEFNVHCSESYKLALVGSVNSIGRFIVLPFVGLLSDRFGRLTVIVVGLTCGSLIGLIKSFSTDYLMYITLEFVEALGTSTYASTFILGIEWVHTDYRVLGSMIVALSFPIGEVLLGFVAMLIHDFRYFLRVLYAPGVFFIIYLYILPESVPWLLVNGRVKQAIKILQKTASMNGKVLSQKSIDMIKLKYSNGSVREMEKQQQQQKPRQSITITTSTTNTDTDTKSIVNPSIVQSLSTIIKSKALCLRFFICCCQFVACSFCYYGLNFSALSIPGVNQYIGFILVVAFEIPGILISIPLLKYMKRRKLMFVSLFVTSLLTIVTPLLPDGNSIIVLISFMLAKTAISLTYNVVYVFTAEQWPTTCRSTIVSTCSMVSRIGSVAAPITIILATYYYALPAILFGVISMVGAISVLFSPETYLKKLPDTFDEAKHL